MEKFKTGQKLRLTSRREATIMQFLGAGAQGDVYLVMVDSQEKALKWYRKKPHSDFIKNLKKNIDEGSPSPAFLWPEDLTREMNGGIGYVMPLCPSGFHDFTKFRLAKVRFTSFRAILNAAISLCDAFRLLHAQGLSYQDLNDGGFFINPSTGEVKICDCDNVCAHGQNLGILGKARFMAPEVVMGKSLPGYYSDRFSLALILFMLFCIDHPFEGMNVVSRPCLTEEIEQHLFGSAITFIYDPTTDINRPVHGIHRNVLTMWPLLPPQLKDAFTQQFSKSSIERPPIRLTERQWCTLLVKLREALVKCPYCSDEAFALDGCRCLNPNCNKPISPSLILEGDGHSIPLIQGNIIRIGKDSIPLAYVTQKPGERAELVLKNISTALWNVITPSGKSICVAQQAFMPAKDGISISFNNLKLKIKTNN